MHTGRTPYEDEDGEPGDACTSQGISKIANKPGQAMRPRTDSFSQPSQRNLADTLILDFEASEL